MLVIGDAFLGPSMNLLQLALRSSVRGASVHLGASISGSLDLSAVGEADRSMPLFM